MAFQPADNLKNRTFIGLIVAQFLAGFNDQAIHAAGMFYALRIGILTEDQAIALMPILFYAPWAIFCTLSGYFADRFSKTRSLVVWKFSEIIISVVCLGGFFLGTNQNNPFGAWIVLACVFLMGTHAAFFAPAKYGAMPEILQPHVLSKGNGVLESTTFLAAILGTVSGGLLSFQFYGNEIWIGVILLALSVLGAAFSLMIAYLPPSNPARLFPKNLFKPLWENLGTLFRSRPLALAALGIAFFVFMVSYMRSTMYMHGQTRNPPWDEFYTSLVVATVALGVGLGAPLAGNLSGGKIELGLVPLGCVGMVLALLAAALEMNVDAALIAALVVIGFFSGFYMVPLYTLLQHRAPKTTKGDLIATSNFINVTGAIAASLLFFLLVQLGRWTGITPEVKQRDLAQGTFVTKVVDEKTHRIKQIIIKTEDGKTKSFPPDTSTAFLEFFDELEQGFDPDNPFQGAVELEGEGLLSIGSGIKENDPVKVATYLIGEDKLAVRHYTLRLSTGTPKTVYNNFGLPRYLFLGAALMTLGIMFLLRRKLPDFFVRTLFWFRGLGRFHIKAVGMHNLPTRGPVILATNCDSLDRSLQVVAATDRYTAFVLPQHEGAEPGSALLRRLAHRTSLMEVPVDGAGESAWHHIHDRAKEALAGGHLLAVTVEGNKTPRGVEAFMTGLAQEMNAPFLPVYCGDLPGDGPAAKVRVVFGEQMPGDTPPEALRERIAALGEWIRHNDHVAEAAH